MGDLDSTHRVAFPQSNAVACKQSLTPRSEREQAKEGQYIREMEAQKLRQLKEKAAAAAKEVEAQQKRMAENGDKAE